MSGIILRPDQAALKQAVYTGWNAGHDNMLAVLPTGGGKSVIVSDIVLDRHQAGARQCVIAHRKELVGQMSLHVARRGIKHRIVGSKTTISQIVAEHRREFGGKSFINPDANCTVASVDTLVSRADTLKQWAAQIDDWTIDEAHHVLKANKWGKAVAMFPNARGLGVTATPRRADGYGLGSHHDGVFDDMVCGPSMRELIDMGALCDYEIAIPESDFEIDEEALAPSGDWSTKRMREASKRSHIVGDVVQEYIKRAFGKRTICFATDVETAGEMAINFNNSGIPTAAVSAETPSEVRNEYIRRFRDGRLWCLVNVDLFGEGFDVPAVEVVIMARPTASLAVYLQQFGRALRTLTGKPYGLVIDHVSNWKRHGFPDKPHVWSLDRRERRAKKEPDPEDIPLTACRQCSRPYERALLACPYCGWEPPLPDPASRTLQQVDGDLMLLDRETLAKMRAATQLETPGSVAERVALAAGDIAGRGAANRQMERYEAQARLRAAIEQWGGCQRAMGRSDREAHRRFYIALGVDVLSALALPRQDMERLAGVVESWCGIVLPESTQKKSDEQLIIERAIADGLQGFRGGWVEVNKAVQMTGLQFTGISSLLNRMGYSKICRSHKTVEGEKLQVNLYCDRKDANHEDFWVENGYVSDAKSTILNAIERGEQGFRGGWLMGNKVAELTGLSGVSLSNVLDGMGFTARFQVYKTIDGVVLDCLIYNTDPNADPAKFWEVNGYVSERVLLIKQAIERGEQGFRGGWLCNIKITELTGAAKKGLAALIAEMGYHSFGPQSKRINGERVYMTLYHTNPNADPADFWRSNGYA